jgi:hypothetical protein
MQIESIIDYEPDTDISSIIKNDILQLIKNEYAEGFENLKDLKERLPANISYPEIRIAVAKLRVDSQRSSSTFQHKQ